MPSDILIIPNRNSTTTAPIIQFSGSQANNIRLEVLTSGSVAFLGKSGSLFSISDNFSGSLMAVGDISGLPILEVFSDDKVVMGRFNSNALVVTGSRVGVGKANPSVPLDVSGSMFITGSLNISSSGFNPSLQNTVSITGSVSVNSMVTATGLTLLQPGFTTSRIISSPGDFTFYSGSTSNPILEIDSIPSSLSTKVSTGNTNTRLILAAESSGATSTFTLPSANDIAFAVGTASLNVPLGIISNKESYFSGSLQVARGGGGGNTARIILGNERVSSGEAYIYLVGDTTYINYGLGIARGSTGANATSFIDHRGTGDFTVGCSDAANLILKTNNTTRILITPGGTVAVGKSVANTSFNLDVNGNSVFSGSIATVAGASFGEGGAGPYSVKINKLTPANGALDVNGNTIITGSLTVTDGIKFKGAGSDILHPFLFITFF